MRILHCCLANFYIDNYGYQENVLPKMHHLQGHEVEIVASTETYLENKKLGYIEPKRYMNEYGVQVTRLPYVSWVPKKIVRKLRIYRNLEQVLETFRPEIIFLHDTQFLSIRCIAKYAKKNPDVKVFADSHTDYVNSAKTWVSKNILHKIVYKRCAQIILPHLVKYYGTLPTRMKFLHEVYSIPNEKIELLELGADDSLFDISCKEEIRLAKRKEFGFTADNFVLVSGGKIDSRKNIHHLIVAFNKLKNKNIKLIIFGTPDEEMNYLVDVMKANQNILYLGWQNTKSIYEILFSADLGVFPGTHSVLWEESAGIGLPCIYKKWEGIDQIDLGGNCEFLDEANEYTIAQMIYEIVDNKERFEKLKFKASEFGPKKLYYSEIAKRAIELN